MRRVADLDPALRARIPGDLIVFDGVCVLCSGFFRFMLRQDRAGRFHFATAQSPLGQDIYRALGLPCDDFETNLVIVDGVIFERLDAFAAAMRVLGGLWQVAAVLRFLPDSVKTFVYHRIARNRYRVFGRSQTCLIPDANLKSRFAPGGF